MRCPTRSTLFPYTTLFRSIVGDAFGKNADGAVLFEDFEAGLERVQHRTHRPRVVLEPVDRNDAALRSEEHTSELQSRLHLVCRLLLEKKKKQRHRLTTQNS